MISEMDKKKIQENAIRIATEKCNQECYNAVQFYANISLLATLVSIDPECLKVFETQFSRGVKNLKDSPQLMGIDEEVCKVVNINAILDSMYQSYETVLKILKEASNNVKKG